MEIYKNEELLEDLKSTYEKKGKKLNMGKSCIRFRKFVDLGSESITTIIASASLDEYISYYEAAQGKNK
jgi:hypothetical protein